MSNAISNKGPLSGGMVRYSPFYGKDLAKTLAADFGITAQQNRNKKILAAADPAAYLGEYHTEQNKVIAKIAAVTDARIGEYTAAGIPEDQAIELAKTAAHRDYETEMSVINLQFPQAALEFGIRTKTGGANGVNILTGGSAPRKARKAPRRKNRK